MTPPPSENEVTIASQTNLAPANLTASSPQLNDEEFIHLHPDLPGSMEKSTADDILASALEEITNLTATLSESSLSGFTQGAIDISRINTQLQHMLIVISNSNARTSRTFHDYASAHQTFAGNQAVWTHFQSVATADQKQRIALKRSIGEAEEETKQTQDHTESQKETLRILRIENSNFNNNLKQGVTLSSAQEKAINELQMQKEAVTRELEEELDKMAEMRTTISEMSSKIMDAEEDQQSIERDISSYKDKGFAKKDEIDNMLRIKDDLEHELRDTRLIVTARTQEVRQKQDNVNRLRDEQNLIDAQMKNQRILIDKNHMDQETLEGRMKKMAVEVGQQRQSKKEVEDILFAMGQEFHIKDNLLTRTRTELKLVRKTIETFTKKVNTLRVLRSEKEQERYELREEIEEDDQKLALSKVRIERQKISLEEMSKERKLLHDHAGNALESIQVSVRFLTMYKQTKHNMEVEMRQFEADLVQLRKKYSKTTKERDRFNDDTANLTKLIQLDSQEIKNKEDKIFEFKKSLMQVESKLKHKQNLYEAVMADRNLRAENLIECENDILEMKRKLKIMNFQINGFKDDLSIKDQILKEQIEERARLEKDIEIINEEIKSLQNQSDLATAYLRSQDTERTKLNAFAKEGEAEKAKQMQALHTLKSEKKSLQNQLLTQNNELANVYQSIKSSIAELESGTLAYNTLMRDLWRLRQTYHSRQLAYQECKASHERVVDLRGKLVRMESDVCGERARQRALEEQLAHPINVHRWRTMEGNNPKAYEAIQLLHHLQKRLLQRITVDREKESLIGQCEAEYLKVRKDLSHQVGPEVMEQISALQQALKDKRAQSRHIEAELEMYKAQVREYQYAVSSADFELGVMKKLLLTYRKKNGHPPLLPSLSGRATAMSLGSRSASDAPHSPRGDGLSPDPLPTLPRANAKIAQIEEQAVMEVMPSGEVSGIVPAL